jgi:type II secretory pathway component GspD/PulD (secretin)
MSDWDLFNNEGVSVMSRPRISTSSGVPASMYIGDGNTSGVGQTLSVAPSMTVDSKDVDLQMDMEFTSSASTTNGAVQNGGQ